MTLNAYLNQGYAKRVWYHAQSSSEVADVIAKLMSSLNSDDSPEGVMASGDIAILCFADECLRAKRPPQGNESHLQVSMNRATGYGALMWYLPDGESVWISDNVNPPGFDPRVIADPGYPLFHDPASTLPLDQFRIVLEEFCYSGTGGRPTGINWISGDMCGRRDDRN